MGRGGAILSLQYLQLKPGQTELTKLLWEVRMESFILKSVALMDEEKGEKLKKFSMTEHVIVWMSVIYYILRHSFDYKVTIYGCYYIRQTVCCNHKSPVNTLDPNLLYYAPSSGFKTD